MISANQHPTNPKFWVEQVSQFGRASVPVTFCSGTPNSGTPLSPLLTLWAFQTLPTGVGIYKQRFVKTLVFTLMKTSVFR